jgi:hypothetical protein
MSQIRLIERFEVMKEGLHHVFVEVIVREELAHRHEDWITALEGKLRGN